MRAYIDGDVIVYRCGFAAERMWYYVPTANGVARVGTKKEAMAIADKELAHDHIFSERELEPEGYAIQNVRMTMATIEEDLAVTDEDILVALSGPTNFRDRIATLKVYKGNRDELHKPSHGPAIKDYFHRTYETVESAGEEADDLLGIYQWKNFVAGDEYGSVIVTVDKDLDMIPGLHYNPVTREQRFVHNDDTKWIFLKQLMTGDSTDNIPGLPGVGPKKAEKFVECYEDEEWDEALTAIERLYVDQFGDNAPMIETGRLVWIRREPNEMWSPELMEKYFS